MLTFILVLFGLLGSADVQNPAPALRAELVFPLRGEHNHASGLVECPNGDLIASWYRGSGERSADDVAIYGARLRKGQTQWSHDFLMADFPGFPDGNTCMMIDRQNRLWLFWPLIIANSWESALPCFLIADEYTNDGAPKWVRYGIIPLKPDDFSGLLKKQMDAYAQELEARVAKLPQDQQQRAKERIDRLKSHLHTRTSDKLWQRIGWQTRCKPTLLPPSSKHPKGRILLPLYTDTFSIGIMAISDDGGRTFFASKPIMSAGGIQPTVLVKNDGTLVAMMRDNGGSGHIKISESSDDGMTWGTVSQSKLANPGAGIDAVGLANGHWCLVYNDTRRGRNSLAVSISEDEGKTWKHTRHLEKHDSGSYHYPCVIQGRDGMIHAIYSYSVRVEGQRKSGESMKHAAFDEEWVRRGDE